LRCPSWRASDGKSEPRGASHDLSRAVSCRRNPDAPGRALRTPVTVLALTPARRNFLTVFYVSKALVAHATNVREEARLRVSRLLFISAPESPQSWRLVAPTLPLPAPGVGQKGRLHPHEAPFPFPGVTPTRQVGRSTPSSRANTRTLKPGPVLRDHRLTAVAQPHPAGPFHHATTIAMTCTQRRGSGGISRRRLRGCAQTGSRGKSQGCPQRNLGRTPDGGSRPIGLSCPQ
jgi:hypothetical protein